MCSSLNPMPTNMLGWLRRIWRYCKRTLKLFILITLPMTFLPILNGFIEGYFSASYSYSRMKDLNGLLKENMMQAHLIDSVSVTGTSSIQDADLEPFYIDEIVDPISWWEKLGMTRFDVDFEKNIYWGRRTIDQLAKLNLLYKRRDYYAPEKPWHHFIYATYHDQDFRYSSVFADKWDEAFNDLLQYHNANPAVGSAKFHYINCFRSFLCNVWWLKAPAVLHFTTEGSEHDSYDHKHVPGYDPVTISIIDLPIRNREDLALPLGAFPSEFEQLRSVTTKPQPSLFTGPMMLLVRMLRVFDTFGEDTANEYPNTYGIIYHMHDTWRHLFGLIGPSMTFWMDATSFFVQSISHTLFDILFRLSDFLYKSWRLYNLHPEPHRFDGWDALNQNSSGMKMSNKLRLILGIDGLEDVMNDAEQRKEVRNRIYDAIWNDRPLNKPNADKLEEIEEEEEGKEGEEEEGEAKPFVIVA